MSDAAQVAALVAAILGAAWGAVLVHEAGHYLVGRVLGVPGDAIRIRLERPPHVALHDGQSWLAPDDPGYNDAFIRHNSSVGAAWWFVAGGFVVETAVVLTLALALQGVGSVSVVVLGTSTVVLVGYLVADVGFSLRRRLPYGDATAMWQMAAVATVVLTATVLLLRVAVLVILAA